MSKPLQSKCSVHRKCGASGCCLVFSPNCTCKSEIPHMKMVSCCRYKPWWMSKSSVRTWGYLPDMTWVKSFHDWWTDLPCIATGSIWLLILSTNQHSIWCVQVLWADKVLLRKTPGDPSRKSDQPSEISDPNICKQPLMDNWSYQIALQHRRFKTDDAKLMLRICIYKYIHMYVCLYVCLYVCMCVCMYMYTQ